MSNVQYLALNTRDALPGGTPANAYWIISQLGVNQHIQGHLQLLSIEFPNLHFAIQTGFNDMIYFEDDGAGPTLSVTIPSQNYTGYDMAAELQSLMTAASANTITVTYDPQTFQLTFSTSGTSLRFVSGVNDAYEELGISDALLDGAYTATVTSDLVVRLDGPQFASIETNCLARQTVFSSDGRSLLLGRVPLEATIGTVVSYQPPLPVEFPIVGPALQNLNLRLIASNGIDLNLPSNCNVTYLFKLTLEEI